MIYIYEYDGWDHPINNQERDRKRYGEHKDEQGKPNTTNYLSPRLFNEFMNSLYNVAQHESQSSSGDCDGVITFFNLYLYLLFISFF